jgi:hypothetical protein
MTSDTLSNPRTKSICFPCESEAQYRAAVADHAQMRQLLHDSYTQFPKLFPEQFGDGFTWHEQYHSDKLGVTFRRLRLRATGEVFLVRPSCYLPYAVARTEEIEKALYLRQWNVPFEALAYVFGRDAMYYYRAWASWGRNSLVGTTVKRAEKLPEHLVADEKHTWRVGEKEYLATTVGGGCILGAELASAATTEALRAAYGVFAAEAREVSEAYAPVSVCTDGWAATRAAWRGLYSKITLVLCFLHGILKIQERCAEGLRGEVLQRAWEVYAGGTKRSFSQRMRRFKEWGQEKLSGAVLVAVLKLSGRTKDYLPAYEVPGAARTSNQVDRLMDYQDRGLYQMKYLHGTKASGKLLVRAQALQWNFHPFGARGRGKQGDKTPFERLNGFAYHPNWLHNLLCASSLGGRRR